MFNMKTEIKAPSYSRENFRSLLDSQDFKKFRDSAENFMLKHNIDSISFSIETGELNEDISR